MIENWSAFLFSGKSRALMSSFIIKKRLWFEWNFLLCSVIREDDFTVKICGCEQRVLIRSHGPWLLVKVSHQTSCQLWTRCVLLSSVKVDCLHNGSSVCVFLFLNRWSSVSVLTFCLIFPQASVPSNWQHDYENDDDVLSYERQHTEGSRHTSRPIGEVFRFGIYVGFVWSLNFFLYKTIELMWNKFSNKFNATVFF